MNWYYSSMQDLFLTPCGRQAHRRVLQYQLLLLIPSPFEWCMIWKLCNKFLLVRARETEIEIVGSFFPVDKFGFRSSLERK